MSSLSLLCVLSSQAVDKKVTLQGNLDPCALYGSQEDIVASAQSLVQQFGREQWIANLGHGIYPDIDPEHLRTFIDSIHKFTQT